MKELAKNFDPSVVEERLYNKWMEKKYFHTEPIMRLLDDHKNGVRDNSRKIWTVYIFLVWYDRYFGHGKPVHPAMHTR